MKDRNPSSYTGSLSFKSIIHQTRSVGVICFSLGITGKIAGACMIANAIFNTFVLCKYPEYAKFRPASAEQEAAAYLQRNPQIARKVGGAVVNAASNNPQVRPSPG